MRRRAFLIWPGLLLSYSGATGQTTPPRDVPVQSVAKAPIQREIGTMVAKKTPVELATTPVTVGVAMNKQSRAQIAAAMSPSSKAKLVLSISGIDFDKRPEVHYQVYLNLPKNEQPNYKSIYFVGNLAFFSFDPHGGMPGHPPVVNFDITQTVRGLRSQKLWNDSQVSVTFVMQWLVDQNGKPLPVPPGVRLRFTTVKIITNTPAA